MSNLSVEQLTLNSGLLTTTGNSLYLNGSLISGAGSTNTGQLTGIFYPLYANPSGYLSSYSQSGAYIFGTNVVSGVSQQFISFPTNLGNNPFVIPSLSNISGIENIIVQVSGITSSGYWAQYSNIIDNSGYELTTFASLSTQTGLATTVIVQQINTVTGNFITSGQTGQFYPSSNPSSYATSGNLSTTGTTLYNDIITLSGYIAPSQNYNFNIDWSKANTFYTILTGNTTFTFSNQKDGQTIIVSISNTGNAGYSGIWPTIKWPNRTTPAQSTGSFTDIFTFIDITGAIYGNVVQDF